MGKGLPKVQLLNKDEVYEETDYVIDVYDLDAKTGSYNNVAIMGVADFEYGKLSNLRSFDTCRAFMQDFLIDKDDDYGIAVAGSKALVKEFSRVKGGLKEFLSFFEKYLDLKKEIELSRFGRANVVVVQTPEAWKKSPPTISLLTYLIRIGVHWRGKESPLEFLKKVAADAKFGMKMHVEDRDIDYTPYALWLMNYIKENGFKTAEFNKKKGFGSTHEFGLVELSKALGADITSTDLSGELTYDDDDDDDYY